MSDITSTLSSGNKIFSDVKYFITGTIPDHVKKTLDDGGGEKINFFSDRVTHCIVGEQPKENDISDAKDLYEVPAVTPYWVLLSSFCNKILPTKGFMYDKKQIFSNVVVTASQISNADFKAVWAMVTFYGGKFKSNLDKTCTHLISGKAAGNKYEAALNDDFIKIVTPDWVVESIKSGSKIDETSFHPKYLIFPKPRESSPPSAGDLSTAQILGFADDITPATSSAENPSSVTSTQALLEKLKQRMPWNRPSTVPPTSTTTQVSFSQSPYPPLAQSKIVSQQPSQLPLQTQGAPSIPLPSNNIIPNQGGQPPQQIAVDQQSRVIQQGPVWRSANPQNLKPQYTLIQRDGSVVQAHAANWPQFHLQQQRLPQQAPAGQQPHVQHQTQQLPVAQPNHSTPHPQPNQTLQQGGSLQSTQIQNPQQAQQSTGAIQVQGGQTQRQITWTQQPQLQGPPKQVIQLDPQTHAQLSQMDPHQRTLFLQKIQRQRQIILQQRQIQLQQQQQQQQQQQRQVGQGAQLSGQQPPQQSQLPPQQPQQQQQQPQPQQPQPQPAPQSQQQTQQGAQPQQQPLSIPMRQPQIIIRGVMPPGLTPQQQAVWLQQQQFFRQQQILVQQHTGQIRQSVSGTQPRIVQQQTATSTWIPQQAENQQQLQLQRQQQLRIQQLQKQQIVVQRAATVPQQFQQTSSQQGIAGQPVTQPVHTDDPNIHSQTPGGVGGGLLVNSRTKTALANMLSSRLQTGHLSPQAQVIGQADGSAAGQLRLMSAQQRTPQPPPPPPPPQSSQLSDAQATMYSQQRRTLGNITNAGSGVRPNLVTREAPSAGTPVPVPKSPARAPLNSSTPATGASVPQKPQFFAHNPNLRIPPDKYFLGCVFLFVEYDRSYENNFVAWEEIIRDHGGEVEPSYTHRVTHVLCETQKHGIVQQALRDGKRCVTAFWLNDVVLRGSLSVPWLALHFPVPFGKEKPLSKYHMTLTGFEDKSERERVATMIQIAGGQYRNYLSPLTHIVICKKAEGAKYKKAKETNKVVVNVQWLNEILFGHYTCIQQPDVHKYQQYNTSACFRVDYALIPHLMGAWKLPINVTSEMYNAVKNSPPPLRKTKKPKLEPTSEQIKELEHKMLDSVQIINVENFSPENRPYVMITGDKNFEMAKKAKAMGCVLARNNSKVTHLVVCGKPMRTLKMLKCLVMANYIVKDSWLIDSYSQNKFLSESSYSIHQVDFDDFKCNISKVLSTPDRNYLFKDKIFYMTPNVEPSRNALGELVILSGGQVEKQRRSVKAIQELNKITPTYIVISCYNDLALIADVFRTKLDFYSTEFIMGAIMTQSIDYVSSVYRY